MPPIDPDLFDDPGDVLWLMHCAEGPVPRAAAEAIARFMPCETKPWRLRWVEDFQGIPERVRRLAAGVLGADARDITLTATTSSGLVTVAQGFPFTAGDEVVVPLGEFPSNLWPWKALGGRGVRLREVALWDGHEAGARAWRSAPPPADCDPESRLLDALGPRTRVLAASWVRFQDGLVLDIPRLARGCRERGIDLVVDGIQGAGTLRADLDSVSAFATGGHKGLLAPQGLGVLHTRPDLRHRLVPTGSWLSVEDATDFSRPSTDHERDWSADGTRLEQGMPNLVLAAALGASLAILAEAGNGVDDDPGIGAIERHVRGLVGRLIARLADLAPWRDEARRLEALHAARRLGAIVSLHHGGRGAETLDRLCSAATRVKIYPSVREGYLRIAFHGWHTEDDVDRVADFLAKHA